MDQARQELVRELFAYLTGLAEDATAPAGDGMRPDLSPTEAKTLAAKASKYASDMTVIAASIEVIARRGSWT